MADKLDLAIQEIESGQRSYDELKPQWKEVLKNERNYYGPQNMAQKLLDYAVNRPRYALVNAAKHDAEMRNEGLSPWSAEGIVGGAREFVHGLTGEDRPDASDWLEERGWQKDGLATTGVGSMIDFTATPLMYPAGKLASKLVPETVKAAPVLRDVLMGMGIGGTEGYIDNESIPETALMSGLSWGAMRGGLEGLGALARKFPKASKAVAAGVGAGTVHALNDTNDKDTSVAGGLTGAGMGVGALLLAELMTRGHLKPEVVGKVYKDLEKELGTSTERTAEQSVENIVQPPSTNQSTSLLSTLLGENNANLDLFMQSRINRGMPIPKAIGELGQQVQSEAKGILSTNKGYYGTTPEGVAEQVTAIARQKYMPTKPVQVEPEIPQQATSPLQKYFPPTQAGTVDPDEMYNMRDLLLGIARHSEEPIPAKLSPQELEQMHFDNMAEAYSPQNHAVPLMPTDAEVSQAIAHINTAVKQKPELSLMRNQERLIQEITKALEASGMATEKAEYATRQALKTVTGEIKPGQQYFNPEAQELTEGGAYVPEDVLRKLAGDVETPVDTTGAGVSVPDTNDVPALRANLPVDEVGAGVTVPDTVGGYDKLKAILAQKLKLQDALATAQKEHSANMDFIHTNYSTKLEALGKAMGLASDNPDMLARLEEMSSQVAPRKAAIKEAAKAAKKAAREQAAREKAEKKAAEQAEKAAKKAQLPPRVGAEKPVNVPLQLAKRNPETRKNEPLKGMEDAVKFRDRIVAIMQSADRTVSDSLYANFGRALLAKQYRNRLVPEDLTALGKSAIEAMGKVATPESIEHYKGVYTAAVEKAKVNKAAGKTVTTATKKTTQQQLTPEQITKRLAEVRAEVDDFMDSSEDKLQEALNKHLDKKLLSKYFDDTLPEVEQLNIAEQLRKQCNKAFDVYDKGIVKTTGSAGKSAKGTTIREKVEEFASDENKTIVEGKIKRRSKKRNTTLNFGVDPVGALADIKDFATLGAIKIARKGLQFADWSTEMVAEYGEKVKPHLNEIWARSQQVLKQYFNKGNFTPLVPDGMMPPFYSQLRTAIVHSKQEKMSIDQIPGILKSAKVPKEELKWTGFMDWLQERKGQKVTKQEVLDYLDKHDLYVEEVTHNRFEDVQVQMNDIDAQIKAKYAEIDAIMGARDLTAQQIRQRREELKQELKIFQQSYDDLRKFTDYDDLTLSHRNAKIYKEVLIRTPKLQDSKIQVIEQPGLEGKLWEVKAPWLEDTNNPVYIVAGGGEDAGKFIVTGSHRSPESFYSLEEATDAARKVALIRKGPDFSHGHWTDDDVLAHVRFSEHEGTNGERILFIEEAQSDWHQQGSRYGYLTDEKFEKLKALNRERQEILTQKGRDYLWQHDSEISQRYWEIEQQIEDLEKVLADGVTDAPFAKDWHELIMKRMLRYAAENGYDQIAWPTRELVPKIEKWTKDFVTGGKGEGIIRRYEETLTNFMNRYAKRWSTQVESSDLKANSKVKLKVIFKDDRLNQLQPAEVCGIVKNAYRTATINEAQFIRDMLTNLEAIEMTTNTAEKFASEISRRFKPEELTRLQQITGYNFHTKLTEDDLLAKVFSVKITPEMRNSVLYEGQPLFSSTTIRPLDELGRTVKKTGNKLLVPTAVTTAGLLAANPFERKVSAGGEDSKEDTNEWLSTLGTLGVVGGILLAARGKNSEALVKVFKKKFGDDISEGLPEVLSIAERVKRIQESNLEPTAKENIIKAIQQETLHLTPINRIDVERPSISKSVLELMPDDLREKIILIDRQAAGLNGKLKHLETIYGSTPIEKWADKDQTERINLLLEQQKLVTSRDRMYTTMEKYVNQAAGRTPGDKWHGRDPRMKPFNLIQNKVPKSLRGQFQKLSRLVAENDFYPVEEWTSTEAKDKYNALVEKINTTIDEKLAKVVNNETRVKQWNKTKEYVQDEINKIAQGDFPRNPLKELSENYEVFKGLKVEIDPARKNVTPDQPLTEDDIIGFRVIDPNNSDKTYFLQKNLPIDNKTRAELNQRPGILGYWFLAMEDVLTKPVARMLRKSAHVVAKLEHSYETNVLLKIAEPILNDTKAKETVTYYLENMSHLKNNAKVTGTKEWKIALELRDKFYNPLFKQFFNLSDAEAVATAERYLENYAPHVRKAGGLENVHTELPDEMSFFALMKRKGIEFPREYDAVANALVYLRQGLKKQYYDPMLESVKQLEMHPDRQKLLDETLEGMLNRPIHEERLINATMDKLSPTVKKLFGDRGVMGATAFLNSLLYVGTLGASPIAIIKQATQQLIPIAILTGNPAYGAKMWYKAVKALRNPVYRDIVNNYNEVLSNREYLENLERQSKVFDKYFRKLEQSWFGLKGFELMDKQNVKISFLMRYLEAEKQGLPFGKRIDLANDFARDTQFGYGMDSFHLAKTPAGKFLLPLASYPIHLARLGWKLWADTSDPKGKQKILSMVGTLLVGQYLMTQGLRWDFSTESPIQTLGKYLPVQLLTGQGIGAIHLDTIASAFAYGKALSDADPVTTNQAFDKMIKQLVMYFPDGIELRRMVKFYKTMRDNWVVYDPEGKPKYKMTPREAVWSLAGPTIESRQLSQEFERTTKAKNQYKDARENAVQAYLDGDKATFRKLNSALGAKYGNAYRVDGTDIRQAKKYRKEDSLTRYQRGLPKGYKPETTKWDIAKDFLGL